MATDLTQLEALPAFVSTWTSSIPRARMELVRSGLRLTAPGHGFETLTLNNIDFRTRFYLTAQGEQIIFFFFRKSSEAKVVLDMWIRFRVLAAPLGEHVHDHELVRLQTRLPAWYVVDPTREALSLYAPPDAEPAQTVLIRLDDGGMLGARLDAKGTPSLPMAWTPPRGERVMFGEGSTWPLAPFESLERTLANWIAHRRMGEPLAVDFAADDPSDAPTRIILAVILRTYQSALAGVAEAPAELGELLAHFAARYRVVDYEGEVTLRLTKTGELAINDEDDPFQLSMVVRFLRESHVTIADVRVAPPDFLVEGELFNAFLDVLQENQNHVAEDIQSEWDNATPPAPDIDQIKALLNTARNGASVFRTERTDRYDRDIFFLRGQLRRQPALIILRGKFEVKTKERKQVQLQGDFKVIFAGVQNGARSMIDSKDAKYFMRLISAISHWRKAVL